MARKLKTYQASLGLFEQAVAAPSMKAALEAWGAPTAISSTRAPQRKAGIRTSSPRPWRRRGSSSSVPWDPTGPSANTPTAEELPASRHLGTQLQAPVHARRPCRGQGSPVRERAADHRPAAGNPRGDEAAPDRDHRRNSKQRHPDRFPGRLNHGVRHSFAAAPLRAAVPSLLPSFRRRPCGRRPCLMTTSSISTLCFIPALRLSTRGTWFDAPDAAWPKSAPSWLPGVRMHPRSHRARLCGGPTVRKRRFRLMTFWKRSARSTKDCGIRQAASRCGSEPRSGINRGAA